MPPPGWEVREKTLEKETMEDRSSLMCNQNGRQAQLARSKQLVDTLLTGRD